MKITISFDHEKSVAGAPYTIFVDGQAVATIRGPMAAVVCELASLCLENNVSISVQDVFTRQKQE